MKLGVAKKRAGYLEFDKCRCVMSMTKCFDYHHQDCLFEDLLWTFQNSSVSSNILLLVVFYNNTTCRSIHLTSSTHLRKHIICSNDKKIWYY